MKFSAKFQSQFCHTIRVSTRRCYKAILSLISWLEMAGYVIPKAYYVTLKQEATEYSVRFGSARLGDSVFFFGDSVENFTEFLFKKWPEIGLF